MNTYFKKSLIALAGAAMLSVGAMSIASAEGQYVPGEGNVPAAGYGVNNGADVGGYAGGGSNLALPFAAPARSLDCFNVIGAPSRYSQDEVSSCRAQTGTH